MELTHLPVTGFGKILRLIKNPSLREKRGVKFHICLHLRGCLGFFRLAFTKVNIVHADQHFPALLPVGGFPAVYLQTARDNHGTSFLEMLAKKFCRLTPGHTGDEIGLPLFVRLPVIPVTGNGKADLGCIAGCPLKHRCLGNSASQRNGIEHIRTSWYCQRSRWDCFFALRSF